MCKKNLHSGTPDPAVRWYARYTYIPEHLIPRSVDMQDILTLPKPWHHSPFIWRDAYTPAHRIPLSVHVQYILTLPKHRTPISVHMFEILTFRYTWSHCPFIWGYTYIQDYRIPLFVHMQEILALLEHLIPLSVHMKICLDSGLPDPCSFICTIYLHFQITWLRCPFICMRYLHFWNTWYHCPFICKIYVYRGGSRIRGGGVSRRGIWGPLKVPIGPRAEP
jgi:hypothetical protein